MQMLHHLFCFCNYWILIQKSCPERILQEGDCNGKLMKLAIQTDHIIIHMPAASKADVSTLKNDDVATAGLKLDAETCTDRQIAFCNIIKYNDLKLFICCKMSISSTEHIFHKFNVSSSEVYIVCGSFGMCLDCTLPGV